MFDKLCERISFCAVEAILPAKVQPWFGQVLPHAKKGKQRTRVNLQGVSDALQYVGSWFGTLASLDQRQIRRIDTGFCCKLRLRDA